MKKKNQLDLNHFFYHLKKVPYVVIKLNRIFPKYYPSQDIDVFCYDKTQLVKKILKVGSQYLKKGFEIEVKNSNQPHTYIDFLLKDQLQFRFDLCQELPDYRNLNIKKHYLYSVIENADSVQYRYKNKPYPFYIPSRIDNLLLRYIEYLEYYQIRPDKIKHLNYITKAIESDSSRISFLDKLHLYTKLPDNLLNMKKQLRKQRTIYFFTRIKIQLLHLPASVISKIPLLSNFFKGIKQCLQS